MPKYADEVVSYIPHLRRYARALLGNDVIAADDLVQDCLERALSRIHLWRRGSNLRAWLFTIMHNQYVNHIRKLSNAPHIIDMEVENAAAHNQESAEQELKIRDIHQAINTLAPDQREVLLLVTLEGLQYREVASILGMPEGTVMSRLSRARSKLRSIMQLEKPKRLKRVK